MFFCIRKLIFGIYVRIPLTNNQKVLLKNFLFQFFAFIFKNTVTYKNWKFSTNPNPKNISVNTDSNHLISLSINEVLVVGARLFGQASLSTFASRCTTDFLAIKDS